MKISFFFTRPAQFIYTSYNQSVYTLLWSVPLILTDQDDQSKLALYSVADGKITQHNIQFSSAGNSIVNADCLSINLYSELTESVKNLKEEQKTIGKTNKTNGIEYGLTEFIILDFTSNETCYFMIGKFDGSIELYKRENKIDFILLCSLFNHQKLITCIKHKNHMGSNLIASGSNDFNVVILDFDKLITDLNTADVSNLLFGKFKHKLIGHKERITCLSWSKHESLNTLASASYDGTVQVKKFAINYLRRKKVS